MSVMISKSRNLFLGVKGGSEEWLLVDKHMVDISGRTCNKIGSNATAFKAQQHRCRQFNGS